tara:strand:- start:42570 stop:42800 length:231 start_codon:yes stop_codon:yes gene_type:complete
MPQNILNGYRGNKTGKYEELPDSMKPGKGRTYAASIGQKPAGKENPCKLPPNPKGIPLPGQEYPKDHGNAVLRANK